MIQYNKKSFWFNPRSERNFAQMDGFFLISVKDVLKSDRLHFFFCFSLDLVKKILKRQLNIDADTAFRISMSIQMKQRLFSFYRSVDIQQCNHRKLFGK